MDGADPRAKNEDVETVLKRALDSTPRASLELAVTLDERKITAKGSVAPPKDGSLSSGLEVEVLLVEDDLVTSCPKGENAGKKLEETAVVKELRSALTLSKEARAKTDFSATFPVPSPWKREKHRVVVVLREHEGGAVWQALDVALVASAATAKTPKAR